MVIKLGDLCDRDSKEAKRGLWKYSLCLRHYNKVQMLIWIGSVCFWNIGWMVGESSCAQLGIHLKYSISVLLSNNRLSLGVRGIQGAFTFFSLGSLRGIPSSQGFENVIYLGGDPSKPVIEGRNEMGKKPVQAHDILVGPWKPTWLQNSGRWRRQHLSSYSLQEERELGCLYTNSYLYKGVSGRHWYCRPYMHKIGNHRNPSLR